MQTSANHLAAIAILSNSQFKSSLSLRNSNLERIQEIINLYGGKIALSKINDDTPDVGVLISSYTEIGSLELWVHVFSTKLGIMLQRDILGGNHKDFEPGTNLTIIDNQYLVISDAS
jgi:hypothetical protein